MHMKLTFALSALLLFLSTSIHAHPLQKRSLSDASDVNALASRDIPENAPTDLTARALIPGSKKALKVAERKENRQLAKKQKWQAGVAAGKYKLGLNGKPVDKNTPMTKKAKEARAEDKKTRAAAHNALSPQDKARKAHKQVAKQAADKATKGTRRQARVDRKAADRATAKAGNKAIMNQARKDYKKSIGTSTFPGRKAQFNTPQGKTYTGRDARQALFNGHAAALKGGVGYESKNGKPTKGGKHPKVFENRQNGDKSFPIPGMRKPGREFGMMHGSSKGYDGRSPNPTEARLITTPSKKGVQKFAGVVAHPAGTDDHVLVPPRP